MSKRRRNEEEPDESIEKRLINLIVRIGDRSILELNSHLQGLAGALGAELGSFRTLITDTIMDCVRGLQPKTPIYGTLCGLLALTEPQFGVDIVAELQRDLQEALDDHATFSIRGCCRFAVELANARVAKAESALDLLDTLLAVRNEPDVLPARAEWFACVVLDCLALGGATFSQQAPERLSRLLEGVRGFDAARRAAGATTTPALLLPYGASTRAAEVTEHFDALLSLVEALASDSHKWRSACLLVPSRVLAEELANLAPLPLREMIVPPHSPGCTYPSLRRLRLHAAPGAADAAAAAAAAGKDDDDVDMVGGTSSSIGVADTVLLEEYTWMLVSNFQDSHKDCAKLLIGLQVSLYKIVFYF